MSATIASGSACVAGAAGFRTARPTDSPYARTIQSSPASPIRQSPHLSTHVGDTAAVEAQTTQAEQSIQTIGTNGHYLLSSNNRSR